MLVSLLDLYLKLGTISVSASELSLSPISYYLLTTSTINYYLKENVNYFGLRRPFYSKQDFKNTYCSCAYTGHKKTNSIELIIAKYVYIR